MRTDDGSCGLPLPVETASPTCEDAPDGCGAVMVATEDEYLATHIANFEVGAIVHEKASESVLPEQLLDACVVGILHLVAIGSMEHVDDDELRRILFKGVAQELEGMIKPHLGGHDAMMDVDVVLVNAGTQIECTYTNRPLLADVEVLGAGITIAKHPDEATEPIACSRIVGTRYGECCHKSVIRQSAHPVFGQKRRLTQKEKDGKQNRFHW